MITPGIKKLIELNAMSLATINKGGKPHAIAVACVKVVEGKIIITNTHIKESIKNIKYNNNVALAVWNKEWEKACVGFELKGKAEYHKRGKWVNFVKNLPENKGYNIMGAIVVDVKKIKELKS